MLKKWISSFVAAAFIFGIIGTFNVRAEGPDYAASRIEGVMVVDVSRSMLSSDPNKISNEAMKMFVDMSSLKGDKIGVVAYGNDVTAKKDIVKIQSEKDKQAIKDFIDSLGYNPNTDMSVGLTEAVKFLDASHEKEYFPLIVLLADGNNDPDKTKGKTAKQADEQTAQAVADAKTKGYPIYVIGLNADGKLNKDLLQSIATSTNGKFFETSNANDLPGILSEIFADHLKLKVVPIKDVVAKNEFQDIKITIPNENVLEANISLVSSKPVELKLVDPSGKDQAIPSDKIKLTKSKNYSMLKIISPPQGDWTLKVKGFPEDKVDINLVFNNDLQLKLAPLTKEFKAGDQVKISSFFEDNGKKITNKDIYQTLKATLFVKNLDTGKSEEIPLNASDKGFAGQFTLGDYENVEIMVKAESDSFFRETQPQKLTILNATAEPVAAEVSPNGTKKWQHLPWLYIMIAAAGAFLIAAPIFSIKAKRKRESIGFSGQIVVEIKDDVTGEWTDPKIKKLKAYKGEFCLNELFLLDPEFKETDQVTFVPITDNTLLFINKSDVQIEMGGVTIDAETGHRLRRNDKLCMRLEELNKSIYIANVS
ncbi:vWA domain-containing protein [Neobacillus sp. WH10]|uniref:vWA domain-containing protein n=1 Tax=Neobacillus sp. WH10 TaxID=3047873 RepID=UPI0024C20B23|nr:vWA domain-containing protein [Neobacillus sp. WH10]WHY76950.1 vWA domain-containing protein [Neobacillus sp. WH10]